MNEKDRRYLQTFRAKPDRLEWLAMETHGISGMERGSAGEAVLDVLRTLLVNVAELQRQVKELRESCE